MSMKPLRQLLGLNLSLKHINEVANVNVCIQAFDDAKV